MLCRRSPFGLLQEDLYPNAWLVLVSCMMLNCTSRKQVERVLPTFIAKWPTPQSFLGADKENVVEVCKPLGFANRRSDNLLKMTERFIASPWDDPRQLPGIGEYAARCYEMLFMNELGEEAPKDHALVQYWHWSKSQ